MLRTLLLIGAITACGSPEVPLPTPRVLSVPATTAKPAFLLVALHGVGSSADDLVPLARGLALELPSVEMLVPDGFSPFDGAPTGRQWFSVRGVTEANRADRIAAVIPPLTTWIDHELAARGLPGDRLILVGFSQGAIVSNWLALSRDPAPRAVVSIAGRLAVPDALRTTGHPRMLLLAGTADTVMPPPLAQEAATGLEARGAEVTLAQIPGLGHGIDNRALAKARAFLADAVR